MKLLITAGPTHEPIDAVRYIGNRSSGTLGAALVAAALAKGHSVTLIAGPISLAVPTTVKRIDVETAEQMHVAVMANFRHHDALIMAAAVADFRPVAVSTGKIPRTGRHVLELESTPDIVADASRTKLPHQRTIGFSLLPQGQLQTSVAKLKRKHLDLMVYNPLETMNSPRITATLLYPDGRQEPLPPMMSKAEFARLLIERTMNLIDRSV